MDFWGSTSFEQDNSQSPLASRQSGASAAAEVNKEVIRHLADSSLNAD